MTVAPNGDLGCRSVEHLASKLAEVANQAEELGQQQACVLVQIPFTVALHFSPAKIVRIFDSHFHVGDGGGLIACTSKSQEECNKAALFLSSLVCPIEDCHLCLLSLAPF